MSEPINCTPSELCTYLQGLAEGYLPTSYLNTHQSVQLKSIPIAGKSYQHGKKTVAFPGFPSFQMSKPLTETLGADSLTYCAADSHAQTSARLGQIAKRTANKKGLMEKAAAYGVRCAESSARFNLELSLLKTPHYCGSADLTLFSESLPSWGIMLDGECFQVAKSARTMNERECILLPTPTAHNAKEGAYPAEHTRNTPTLAAQVGGKVNPDWNEWRMVFPIKWTALEQSAMPNLQLWQQAHSGFYQKDLNET